MTQCVSIRRAGRFPQQYQAEINGSPTSYRAHPWPLSVLAQAAPDPTDPTPTDPTQVEVDPEPRPTPTDPTQVEVDPATLRPDPG